MSIDKQLVEMADDIKELDRVSYSPESTYNLRRAARLRSMGYAKIDEHFKLLSERITKLEHDNEMRKTREKVMSLFSSMRYGTFASREHMEYYKGKLNEIFGTGNYQDTDSVKQNGYGVQMTIFDDLDVQEDDE